MKMLLDKIVELHRNKRGLIVSASASSVLFSLLLVLPAMRSILSYTPEVKDFSKHIMSWATASNLDIASRINSYYAFLAGIVFVAFLLFIIICRVFSGIYNESNSLLFDLYIRGLSYIGIAGVVASALSASVDFLLYLVGGAVLLGWIYFFIAHMKKKESLDLPMLIFYLLVSMPLSLFVWVVSKKIHIIDKLSSNLYFQKMETSADAFCFVIIWFSISILVILLFEISMNVIIEKLNLTESKYKNAIVISSIPFAVTGIIQSSMLELLNILNKRFDIIFYKPNLMYFIILAISLLVMGIMIVILFKKNSKYLNVPRENIVYKIYFPLILVTFALMIAQPSRMAVVGSEFFEMANHGLSVDHLFRYGSIPIVETFDAHMLSNQIFAYVYSLINGYEPWAAFLYNQYIEVAFILVLFYLFKSLIGEINSFFFVLTFPLLGSLVNVIYLLSGILVFCIYKCFEDGRDKRNNYRFWLIAGTLCVYRLDLGVAAVFGAVFTYLAVSIIYKRYSGIIKFLISGFISGVSAVFIFVVLCLFKGINPKVRIIELIKLCQSNQNWAYASVGDNNLVAYVLAYYIFPILIIGIVLFLLLRYTLSVEKMLQVNQRSLIMFFFFSAFFIFNISRGIVRHSLAEGNLIYVLGTFSLAVLSFSGLKKTDKNRLLKFLIASIVTVILININYNTLKGNASIATRALASTNYQQQYSESYAFQGTRIYGEIPADAKQLKGILDGILNKNETYFDFSSMNYFYALVGRENPIYANQSPLLLSDDFTQQLALDELKSEQPPIVLMPIAGKQWSFIDNIAVDFKYYMLSEYIYENYTPLIRLSSFDVYSLKANKDTYLEKLDNLKLTRDTIYSDNFKYADLEGVSNHNTTIEKDDNGDLTVITNGDDPYVSGRISQLLGNSGENIKYEDNKPTKIKVDYVANEIGNLQLFYSMQENGSFSEIQSQTYNISTPGKGNIEIDLLSIPCELRLDINMNSIILKGINITQGLEIIDSQPEVWSRSIGDIPMLWAERDGNDRFRNAPKLPEPFINVSQLSFSTENLIKDQPMYLLFQAESAENYAATIELGSKEKNKVGEFSLNLSKGIHDYAIRLSTDYKWWNDDVEYINLKTNGDISLRKLSYFVEGENKYYNVKQQLRLANITDENWNRGVGRNINKFLFDNTPYNLEQLDIGRKLVFNNGRDVAITAKSIHGSYIHVEIKGEVSEYLEVASFPNVINLEN